MAPQRVLLVDDQPSILHFLRCGLEEHWPACLVDVASSAEQAQPLLATRTYDAIVTDYHLGDGDGVELARLARQYLPEVSIVLVSASRSALAQAEAEALQAGVGSLLCKPFNLQQLLSALETSGTASQCPLP
ncbi:MAG: response regulator [Anaerolineae bacterium]|jgi:DNA-binding response OmpR family regulator